MSTISMNKVHLSGLANLVIGQRPPRQHLPPWHYSFAGDSFDIDLRSGIPQHETFLFFWLIDVISFVLINHFLSQKILSIRINGAIILYAPIMLLGVFTTWFIKKKSLHVFKCTFFLGCNLLVYNSAYCLKECFFFFIGLCFLYLNNLYFFFRNFN